MAHHQVEANDSQHQQQQQKQKQATVQTADGGGPINANFSIFVPLLSQPHEGQPPSGSRSTDRRNSASRSQDVEKMFHNRHRPPWIRRTVWLTALLALLLFTGSIAVLDSLVDNTTDNTESGQSNAEGGGNEELSSEDAKNYLYNFGYLNAPRTDKPADANALLLQAQPVAGRRKAHELLEGTPPELFKSAIRRFQEFAGLPPTGKLDNRTKKKMKQPRCGVQDVKMLKDSEGGEENVSKWQKRHLTYNVDDFTGDLPQHMQKKALQMAFDLWSRIVPLEFSESSSDGQADIRIRFAREDHGDPWPFKGRGGDLAHATYPPHGLLHFDNDEYWAFMDSTKILSDGYIDLFWVSLHEIGHVIGLDHSEVNSAIMAPFYGNPNDRLVDWRGNYKLPELTSDDIRAAMQIYVTSGTGGNRRTGFIFHRVASNQRLVTSGGWTIQAGGLKATKTTTDWAHVYATQPFPVASASPEDKLLYYFEVTFTEMSEYSVMIGLCGDNFPFTSTETWVGKIADSFAIENDGDYYASDTYKKGFAKGTFNNTDVVGCGLMVMPTERRLFFTKNGEIWVKPILLGAEDAKANLYPIVTDGNRITVVEFNFGTDLAAKPFKYSLFQLHMVDA